MLIPTPRLAALVALGALALTPGLSWPALLGLGLLYDLLLLAFCLADLLGTPRATDVRLSREVPPTLSLGVGNPVTLLIQNNCARRLTIQLHDDVPPLCGEPVEPPPLTVVAGGRGQLRYQLEPTRRGRGEFGTLTARWRSPFGLFERQASQALPQTVRVYPNLRALQRPDALHRAGRLLEAGIRSARLRGAGTEFEALRDYQPDDEFRRIDWGATARRGRLVSRQYEIERSQTVMLCLDAGRLMTTQLGELTRLDHALNALLMLAGVAMRLQDKVGLLVFAEEPLVYLPAQHGTPQLQRILEAVYDLEGRYSEPDYGAAFRLLGLRQRKRSLVVLFTDLVDPNASQALLSYTTALRPAHLPIFVSVRDPAVLELADRSPCDAADVYDRALATDLLAVRSAALDQLRARGIAVVDSSLGQVPSELVKRYIEAKVKLLL